LFINSVEFKTKGSTRKITLKTTKIKVGIKRSNKYFFEILYPYIININIVNPA